MENIKSYKDLNVWQKAVELVKEIYLLTKEFPKDEQFTLINQMRRSAISIPSNISEGKVRGHRREYVQFLYVALGSCAELETQIIISKELSYITTETKDLLLEKIGYISRMLRNLIKGINNYKPTTQNL